MVAARMVFSLLALATAFILVSSDVPQRVVTVKPWPDCEDYSDDCDTAMKSGSNVVYAKARAVGANDSLLYAFSTIGTPSIVVAHVTGADTDMHFNWTMLINNETSLEDAITINTTYSTVDYKFGVAFTRLIEYYDKDDSADLNGEEKINNSSYWKIRDFKSFKWAIEPNGALTNFFIFNASSDIQQGHSPSDGKWSISFTFTVQQDSGRSTELPSLMYGANETMLDFIIANYTPEFSNSRFALEAVLVSQSSNTDMHIETIDSIDDEYSPGVFQIINWLSNPSAEQSSGYVQWKPVCYNSNSRSRSSATKVKHYDLSGLDDRENTTKYLNTSIILALFGKDLYNKKLVIIQATNISFGLSQDGFYDQTNYTAWSAAIGYGTPPVDTISLTVIITISAGLGLPVIILIFGGVYTCVKKAKKNKTQYEVINSDTVSRTQHLVN